MPKFSDISQGPAYQVVIPASNHNMPVSIAGSGTANSSILPSNGFQTIIATVNSSQNGTIAIQGYIDPAGTIAHGSAVSTSLTSGTAASATLSGQFQTFKVTITNSSGSTATLSNFQIFMSAMSSSSGAGGGPSTDVNVLSSALPTGAATSANQTTGNTNLSTIATNTTKSAITMAQSTLSMTTTSQTALASNASAKYRLFVNMSTTSTAYLGINTAAVSGAGIPLFPSTSYEMSLNEGNLDTRQINALIEVGTANLLIIEGT